MHFYKYYYVFDLTRIQQEYKAIKPNKNSKLFFKNTFQTPFAKKISLLVPCRHTFCYLDWCLFILIIDYLSPLKIHLICIVTILVNRCMLLFLLYFTIYVIKVGGNDMIDSGTILLFLPSLCTFTTQWVLCTMSTHTTVPRLYLFDYYYHCTCCICHCHIFHICWRWCDGHSTFTQDTLMKYISNCLTIAILNVIDYLSLDLHQIV